MRLGKPSLLESLLTGPPSCDRAAHAQLIHNKYETVRRAHCLRDAGARVLRHVGGGLRSLQITLAPHAVDVPRSFSHMFKRHILTRRTSSCRVPSYSGLWTQPCLGSKTCVNATRPREVSSLRRLHACTALRFKRIALDRSRAPRALCSMLRHGGCSALDTPCTSRPLRVKTSCPHLRSTWHT